MKEGDIFESLLSGTEYIIKSIVNRMVLLQSRRGDCQIITTVEALKIKSLYKKKPLNAEL